MSVPKPEFAAHSMSTESNSPTSTLALNTVVEKEFVSPLTAIRSALELLRDFPDLQRAEQLQFLENALGECGKLENSIDKLAVTAYAAGDRSSEGQPEPAALDKSGFEARINFLQDEQIIEIDFSDFEFSSTRLVNQFYDLLDRKIEASGKRWYILVNYQNCSVWPEAWISFAHRGRKVNVSYSLGSVRYAEKSSDTADSDLFDSRDAALARIEKLRQNAQ